MEHVGVNGSSCNISVFINKINHLKQSVLDLECEEKDITEQLQLLESRGKKRKPEVENWLEELQKMKESAGDMNNLNDIDVINRLINNMKWYKKAKPLTLSTEFVGEALDENIKEVLELLIDDKVFVIGIYGMGGVGKTLLATLVENEVKRKSTFKNVFWVTVSHNFSISKLQHDIAKRIGLKFDDEDERIRADNLSSALETKEKSVLILDDVWKYIDLEKVGIHPKVNGIKVILTTRLEHVCHQMNCLSSHMIEIIPLKSNEDEYDEDDWKLFMLKFGQNGTPATLSPKIEKIARYIVEKCDGLPLGINVMARTMKGIDDIYQWKHAMKKLEKLEMGQEMVEEVFKVLKCSYDNLMEKDLQNCFLYSALTSHFDNKCQKDELIMNLVDNGLINGNGCLKEIFDEGYTILSKLKSHSLISFSSSNSMVHTHSLVINMACYILKESKKNVMVKFENQLTKIALTQEWTTDLKLVNLCGCVIEEILEDMSPNCPILSTLIINKVKISHVLESFFKYMNCLSILNLSYNKNLVSLPNSVSQLSSLISLILNECNSLKHVPPLGELPALSRLVISYTLIEKVPQGLEKLTNLKWLDLSNNENLYLESESFLFNLTNMQYLNLQNTSFMITVEDVQGMNMLECFGGAVDCEHFNVKNKFEAIFGLKAYNLILGSVLDAVKLRWSYIYRESILPDYPSNRKIHFTDCKHDFSHILPNNLTDLLVNKNHHWVCLCSALSYNSASSLRKIKITGCLKLESLFCLSCSFCTNIHNLESLKLLSLESLSVVVWKDVVDVGQSLSPGGIFSCLKKLSIYECHLIEKLFTPQLVLQLLNMETIFVFNCDSMKEIFAVSNNDGNDSSSIALPKLTKLELWGLPQLKIVCKQRIHCGSSRPMLDIYDCENLERQPTVKFIDDDDEIPYFGIIP